MSETWLIVACAALGAALGVAAVPVVGRLLTGQHAHPAHPAASVLVTASASAVLFGLLAWRIGAHIELAAYGCLAAASIPLTAVDLIEQRLPTAVVLPLYPLVGAVFGVATVIDHDDAAMMRALLGMSCLLGFYLVIALTTRGALGAGDVRLAGVLGLALAWRGWTALITGTLVGLLAAALGGAALIAARRADRHTPIPFGPALVAGTMTAILVVPTH